MIGVRRLIVHLHHFLAAHSAAVGDGHLYGYLVVLFGHGVVAPRKVGIRNTVTERVLHDFVIRVIARVRSAEYDVLIPRFVILVSDVNALGVRQIVVFRFGIAAVFPIFEVAHVLHGGRGEHVVSIGVHQSSRRIDFARKYAGNGRHTELAYAAHPQAGVHAVLVEKAQLHGVGRVEQHYYLVELRADVGEQFALVRVEFEYAARVFAVRGYGHIAGQVAVFAPRARDHDYRGVIVRIIAAFDFVRIFGIRDLVYCKGIGFVILHALRKPADHSVHVFGRIKHPQRGIDRETLRFESVFERLAGAAAYCARSARRAVNKVYGRLTETAEPRALAERKRVVLVFQQHRSFRHYRATEVCRSPRGLRRAFGVPVEILIRLIVFDGRAFHSEVAYKHVAVLAECEHVSDDSRDDHHESYKTAYGSHDDVRLAFENSHYQFLLTDFYREFPVDT